MADDDAAAPPPVEGTDPAVIDPAQIPAEPEVAAAEGDTAPADAAQDDAGAAAADGMTVGNEQEVSSAATVKDAVTGEQHQQQAAAPSSSAADERGPVDAGGDFPLIPVLRPSSAPAVDSAAHGGHARARPQTSGEQRRGQVDN